MAGLRTFDAFPKTRDEHQKKSTKGGYTSILMYLFLLFVIWSDFGEYFGGYVDHQYSVNDEIKETVNINIDLFVKMPCELIHIMVSDQTLDRKLPSNELTLEEMPFFIPFDTRVNGINEIITPELNEILGEAIPAQFREKLDTRALFDENDPEGNHLPKFDGCHIFGSLPVNRVEGQLHITAKGVGYSVGRKPPIEMLDFTHVINEFSFGDFYPYIDNPLDNTAKFNLKEPTSAYTYYTSVIPTFYSKLGAEVDTYQYSVKDMRSNALDENSQQLRKIPGILFKYNFEPLSIFVLDKHISFLRFLVKLVALLSFVLYSATWTFTLLDMAVVFIFGAKFSFRYHKNSDRRGILDSEQLD